MIRERIKKDILKAIDNLQLTINESKVELARTANSKFGDYSTNVALKIGSFGKAQDKREIKQSPMEFAKILADSLKNQPYLEKLEVKEPGFINFFVKDNIWQKEVEKLLNKKAFGSPYSSKKII